MADSDATIVAGTDPAGEGRLAIHLEGLVKQYGALLAVDHLSLDIREGEFVTLLGPSGCGKTTTLRIIAGFVEPDAGQVWLRGRDITDVPPSSRNIGMVYQQYALFPHMTVFENVAFGLRVRRLSGAEIRRRVQAALELVRLEAFARRLPRTLSGGQQQRVALARTLVIEPEVLLLDEPLSNLDAKLRRDMQLELRRLQSQLQITTVYVTHDQSEALAMSDRIAVMNLGRIEQLDAPAALYHRPRTAFVAGFIGQANLLEATVVGTEGGATRIEAGEGWQLRTADSDGLAPGARVLAVVRPEAIGLTGSPVDGAPRGEVVDVVYGGATLLYRIALAGGISLLVESPNLPARIPLSHGASVWAEVPPEAVTLLPAGAADVAPG